MATSPFPTLVLFQKATPSTACCSHTPNFLHLESGAQSAHHHQIRSHRTPTVLANQQSGKTTRDCHRMPVVCRGETHVSGSLCQIRRGQLVCVCWDLGLKERDVCGGGDSGQVLPIYLPISPDTDLVHCSLCPPSLILFPSIPFLLLPYLASISPG